MIRVGNGYDVHRLVEGRRLIIGGVDIPFEKGLLGHSDADVLAHAVIDALLGAAAMDNIGVLFPDSDPRYRGADSLHLLRESCQKLKSAGWSIENVDSIIVAQKPKMMPYVPQMRDRMARAMGIELSQLSVKAKTEEGLGFTGNGEGIAAHAVCLLSRK